MLFDVPVHDLAAGDRQLLQDSRNRSGASKTSQVHLKCNLRLKLGGRYLLLGKNGCGKTTLLRAVHERRLAVPEAMSTFLVDQELTLLDPGQRVLQSVLSSDARRCDLQRRCSQLEAQIEAQCGDEQASLELGSLYEALTGSEEEAVRERRARAILSGLGFSTSMEASRVSELSGGWRMRTALAMALFMEPTLLMLDEPTNHLDVHAVLWLQQYLVEHYSASGGKTLLCVSHDRSFSNAVLTEMIAFEGTSLSYFAGPLEEFEAAAEQVAKHMEREAAALEKKRAAADSAIRDHQEREARSMKNVTRNKENRKYGPGQACFYGSEQSSKVTALNRKLERVGMEKTADGKKFKMSEHGSRLGSLDDNEGEGTGNALTAAPLFRKQDSSQRFLFDKPGHLGVSEGMPILQLQDVDFSYPGQSALTLRSINFSVSARSRTALIGANGAGKTTLMSLITGRSEPSSGSVWRHRNLRIGCFCQGESEQLQDMELTPLAYLQQCFPRKVELEMRALLGSFGIKGGLACQPLPSLSGGQRARVALAKVCAEQPQLLVLDEPTNHLDLYSIDALTDGLKAFQGAVILATHNRSMLQSLCEHIVLLQEGSLQTVSLQDDESLEQWFLRAAARQGASAVPRAGRGRQEAPDVPQVQGSATASAQASATDVVAGAAKAGRLPLVAAGFPRPARAAVAADAAAAADAPALRETEKEFLRCVKRVRETLKLEALRASGRLQKTQEEKLQRKAEAWRELSDSEAYLPQDSSLRAKNMDLLALLASAA